MRDRAIANPKHCEKAAAALLAVILWQALSMAVASPWLLASPVQTLRTLFAMLPQAEFWQSLGYSFIRILAGFCLAFAVGTLLALLAGSVHLIEVLLWPYITVIKATPVASFIILCLIWLDSDSLSVFISFLMVLPIVYTNILAGLHARDKRLREMADVFAIDRASRFLYIDLPQIRPYIHSACTVGVGLAWKAGIAAEIIGIPTGSIGERLYQAKIYLSTGELFAWTLAAVLCSVLLEKLLARLLSAAFGALEARL